MSKFYYLIVPDESQCRIVMRFHEGIRKPLEDYRNYPDEWKEVGLMKEKAVRVSLSRWISHEKALKEAGV